MKKYKNILYLVDNSIYYFNSKKNITYQEKIDYDVIKYGKVANIKKFNKYFFDFINKNKLNNYIFGTKLAVIHNPEYTKADIDLLNNILESFNYRKVEFVNELKIYNVNSNNAYLNYNDSYFILSLLNTFKQKQVFLIDSSYFTNKEIIDFILKKIGKKDLFIFGNNKNIESFINELKISNCYHFNNDKTFLIDKLIN